jgi:hypothetical protein
MPAALTCGAQTAATLLDKYKSAAPHKAAAKKRTGRRVQHAI